MNGSGAGVGQQTRCVVPPGQYVFAASCPSVEFLRISSRRSRSVPTRDRRSPNADRPGLRRFGQAGVIGTRSHAHSVQTSASPGGALTASARTDATPRRPPASPIAAPSMAVLQRHDLHAAPVSGPTAGAAALRRGTDTEARVRFTLDGGCSPFECCDARRARRAGRSTVGGSAPLAGRPHIGGQGKANPRLAAGPEPSPLPLPPQHLPAGEVVPDRAPPGGDAAFASLFGSHARPNARLARGGGPVRARWPAGWSFTGSPADR